MHEKTDPGVARSAPVTVRPVLPGDLPRLDALLTGLDEQGRYRRWFTGAIDIHRAVAWAAQPDLHHAVGLVAITADDALVGHAAFVVIDDVSAEVCFEVAAPWRHHGIAGALLAELERRAARRGLRTLVAEVLPGNADMLAVLREHGPCREHREDDVCVVELEIEAAHEHGAAVAVGRGSWRRRHARRSSSLPQTITGKHASSASSGTPSPAVSKMLCSGGK
jgi:GNAT superfamily N-acetyltransferase